MVSQSTAQMLVVVATLCAVLVLASGSPATHSKARTTRGFKNGALSTARGFGKRAGLQMENIEQLTDPSRDFFGRVLSERPESESFPLDWLAEELSGNPELARLVVSRFIDRNQDGELTADELLRTSY